jgi:hypothetical protein
VKCRRNVVITLRVMKHAPFRGARRLLYRQIAATDAQIDQLVYQLYELTPDEIQIVAQATAL